MRYLSLFSGVEAASVAWMPLGWEPIAFCEIDEFPSAVLEYRFPGVPNLGDICQVDWEEFNDKHGTVDVLVGGSPCQSFSIAGGRAGLQGESRLMFEYIRAVRDLVRASGGKSPRYIIWENVPGALSSESGAAFEQLLRELDELGYGLAWRVLDAQFARVPDRSPGGFFGPVAQRRRRVFLVGVLGSPHAAEILFERGSLCGDHPSSRETRESLAADPNECAPVSGEPVGFKWHQGSSAGGIGDRVGQSPTLIADYHQPAVLTPWDVQSKRIYTPGGTSPALQSGTGEGMNIQPIVMMAAGDDTGGDTEERSPADGKPSVLSFVTEYGGKTALGLSEDHAPTILSKHAPAICLQTDHLSQNGTNVSEEVCKTLDTQEPPAVFCMADDNANAAVDENLSGTLKVGGGLPLIASTSRMEPM